MARQKLILRHKLALGDTICFTALARDIELNYPGQYDIYVDSHFREVWRNNPYAREINAKVRNSRPRATQVEISYLQGLINSRRGNKIHMVSEYHRDFTRQTGIPLPVRFPKGDIHLSEEEKKPIVGGRYWVMLAGGKLDMTVKIWWYHRYQQVVDMLLRQGVHCVQAGVKETGHRHAELTGTLNMIGKYKHSRHFMNLIMHADGVICPITAGMHIAAVFDKPCVVIAGGREDPWWEAYCDTYGSFGPQCAPVKTSHRYLHTLGQLHCCQNSGCGRKRIVPIEHKDTATEKGRRGLCKEPVKSKEQAQALCMDMITADHVVEAVMSYYENGEIPPIGKPKGKYSLGNDQFEEPELIPPDKLAPVIANPPAAPPGAASRPEPRVIRKVEKPLPPPSMPIVNAPKAPPSTSTLISNPIIGNKFTICVLCYGPHADLAKRCIGSILDTVPQEHLDLRVACNQVEPATIEYLKSVPTTKVYINGKNRKKYPVMREMFWDDSCPINTNYVLWFDDDTQVVDQNWLVRLTEIIVTNHSQGCRMFGWKMIHDLKIYAKGGHRPDRWFREADWHQGRHFRMRRQDTEAPNGTVIQFAAGWFWALATETIRRGNIPDLRLNHNGGDITIGEQVHQAGAKIKMFNKDKVFVWCPKKDQGGRRGFEEMFPWAKPVAARS